MSQVFLTNYNLLLRYPVLPGILKVFLNTIFIAAISLFSTRNLAVFIFLLAGLPGAAWNISQFSSEIVPCRLILRKKEKNRWAMGWVMGGAGLPACHQGQVK